MTARRTQRRRRPGRTPAARWRERAAAASTAAVLLAACGPEPPRRPNFILILVDTLRADYLGAYGFPGPITPNLDRLQSESVLFESCFAQAPWTKPSVASLFTSLYPQVHGVINYDGRYGRQLDPRLQTRTGILPESAQTLAEALRDDGYQTAAFVANVWISRAHGFAQGFGVFHDSVAETGRRSAETLIDAASEWLDHRGSEQPFFLYLHFMEPHAPYQDPSREHYELLAQSPGPESDRRLTPAEVPTSQWPNIEARPAWASDEMRRTLRYWQARYAAGVHAFDLKIATLLDALRQTGVLDESYVVVTSDHGEELFEHGGWSHGRTLYDHQLRVPLLIRAPGGRGGGRRVAGFVELIDVMPTMLSLAGAEPQSTLQGRDVSALLRGGTTKTPELAFATATTVAPGLYSVRTPGHKLILDVEGGAAALYDLAEDPGEQAELSRSRPQLTRRLSHQLRTHIETSLAAGALDAESAEIPSGRLTQLRALGYLGAGSVPDPAAASPPAAGRGGGPRLEETADGYVNLSLEYFQLGEFRRSIEAGERALALDPRSAIAHNNICSAHNALEQWDRAIEACTRALELVPDFELAKNNLAWARANKRP